MTKSKGQTDTPDAAAAPVGKRLAWRRSPSAQLQLNQQRLPFPRDALGKSEIVVGQIGWGLPIVARYGGLLKEDIAEAVESGPVECCPSHFGRQM